MSDPIESKISEWEKKDGIKYREINQQIIHLDRRLYHDYEPTLGPHSKFLHRLSEWLNNTDDDEQQKILFELVPNIFYVSREEVNVLYREAYITNYTRWLIDQLGINFLTQDFLNIINKEVTNTWFCPITDSLRINLFYHINNIPGKHDYRPDWRSLVKFGNADKIKAYLQEQGIKRIVLLEDFIGNGGQVSKAVMFAAQKLDDIPILIIPLIICPKGIENAKKLLETYPNLSISPIVSIPKDSFIAENENDNKSTMFKRTREISIELYPTVSNSQVIDDNTDPYGPFGWRRTGGLVVMYINTPNNSLPLIHNKSETWAPLFIRHKRV